MDVSGQSSPQVEEHGKTNHDSLADVRLEGVVLVAQRRKLGRQRLEVDDGAIAILCRVVTAGLLATFEKRRRGGVGKSRGRQRQGGDGGEDRAHE